jgi:N-acetylglutamate synthase-like GNAT family acetyltransferase
MIGGRLEYGRIAGMGQHADEAEMVITAKIDEDFARAATDPSLAAAKACFGHTTATWLAALPGHPAYNKARGFNNDDIDQLEAICAFFTDAALLPLIEVWAGDASASLGRRLAYAGFYAAEVNVTLQAQPSQPSSTTTPDPGIEIREVAASDDDTVYLKTLFNGYGLSTEPVSPQQTMMAIEHRSPHLRRYLAYVDDQPAAAAALYTTQRGAYFAGAATIPAMRHRGCQSALIRRRLHDAAATAQQIAVTTAFGSPSQANLQRLGFSIAHTRTVWRPLAMT